MLENENAPFKIEADKVLKATQLFVEIFEELNMTPKLAKIALITTLEAIDIAEKEDPTCN